MTFANKFGIVDAVVQILWSSILALLYISGAGGEDCDAALALLVAWQVVSLIVRLATNAGGWTKRIRVTLLVSLLGISGLSLIGSIVIFFLGLITLGLADVDFDNTLIRWLALVLVIATAGFTARMTWTIAPDPNITDGDHAPLPVWPPLRPLLRFIIPNLLLLASLNALLADLGYQLAGEEWMPVVLCLLTLFVGWLCSLGLPPMHSFAFKVWSRIWWLAALPLIFLILSTVPPVRRAIILHDHSQTADWSEFPGPLGLAHRRHFYSQEFSAELLMKPGVIERRLARYAEAMSPYTELWPERHELVLCCAALRLRGESWDTIASRPLGPHLIVATLLAEADPPYWVPKAGWLLDELEAKPAGSFRLGMIDRTWAETHLKAWCDEEHLGAVLSRDACDEYMPTDPAAEAAWREHGRRGSLVRGLLHLSLKHSRLLDETAVQFILAKHLEHAAPTESLAGLEAAIQARHTVRSWAAARTGAEGQWPVHIDVPSHAIPYLTSRQIALSGITDFIRHCGFEVTDKPSDPGNNHNTMLVLDLAAQTFPDVVFSTEQSYERQRRETVRRLSGQNYTRSTSESKLVTTMDSTVSEQRGELAIPSLILRSGVEDLCLPPAAIVDKGVSDTALSHLPPGVFPAVTDYLSVINLFYHIQDTALSPWRFGLPPQSEPDSLLHLDNWDDVPREVREWN
jgi:hypothetical protein